MARHKDSDPKGKIHFEHTGIGQALKNRGRLKVPVNQREYKWEQKHVDELFHDFSKAISSNGVTYFLGTIVLTGSDEEVPEVVDGQQRLATTTIFLAAVRDYLLPRESEKLIVRSIEDEFLYTIIREQKDVSPRLSLNVEDNEFFKQRILLRPDNAERKAAVATKPSHKRIEIAAKLAAKHVQKIVAPFADSDRVAELNKWIRFVEYVAQVIVLRVPDDLNAYVMFETLNDRGLKTTQADLVKNFLFGEADERLEEAQHKWTQMTGALESLDVDEEMTITYLRHLLSSLHGLKREREVLEAIKTKVTGRGAAISFSNVLAESVIDYVALYNPDHTKWNEYDARIRGSLRTLNSLQPGPIWPLMFAVARKFTPIEAEKAFRLFINWVVRFLVVGGARTGSVEEAYSDRAKEVTDRQIRTTQALAKAMASHVPTDVQFEGAFAGARVSKNSLARYYLRALERKMKNDPEPAFIPNEDTVINLEHILPENPGKKWGKIPPEIAVAYYRRIGNLALLQASKNSNIGNDEITDKLPILSATPYLLTQDAAHEAMLHDPPLWGADQINNRQARLAKLAIKTWPLTVT